MSPDHCHLCIRLDAYEANVSAQVHYHAYSPEYAWRDESDELLFRYDNKVVLTGVCIEPNDRTRDTYELKVYGDNSNAHGHDVTLRDIHATEGKYGVHQYRTYRGREVPVYQPPEGLALLSKVRGERLWTAALFAPTRFVAELMALLSHEMQLYVELHECKEGRDRWLRGVSLRTHNPADGVRHLFQGEFIGVDLVHHYLRVLESVCIRTQGGRSAAEPISHVFRWKFPVVSAVGCCTPRTEKLLFVVYTG